MRRLVTAAAVAVLACGLAACDEGAIVDLETVQPEGRDDGIQATGLLDGKRVAISRGNPRVVLGDCDVADGIDEDLCILARTIDGLNVELVIENPAVLLPGETVAAGVDCSFACDDVTEGAVVEVRLDSAVRDVERGSLTVREAGPRWIADFDLDLSFGDNLSGTFDVAPTPPD